MASDDRKKGGRPPEDGHPPATSPFALHLAAVIEAYLDGKTTDEIRARIEGWGCSDAEAALLLLKAEEKFRQLAATKADVELGKALAQLAGLWETATTMGDVRAALAVRKEMSVLLNLTPGQAKRAGAAVDGSVDPLDSEIRRLETELKVS